MLLSSSPLLLFSSSPSIEQISPFVPDPLGASPSARALSLSFFVSSSPLFLLSSLLFSETETETLKKIRVSFRERRAKSDRQKKRERERREKKKKKRGSGASLLERWRW